MHLEKNPTQNNVAHLDLLEPFIGTYSLILVSI